MWMPMMGQVDQILNDMKDAVSMRLSPPTPLILPRMTTFTIRWNPQEDRTIAHALDFDLVTTGDTEREALERLRSLVKMHIRDCLRKGANPLFPAPDRYWNILPGQSAWILPPIETEGKRLFVVSVRTPKREE